MSCRSNVSRRKGALLDFTNMSSENIIGQIRAYTDQVSRLVTQMHPLTAQLGAPDTQGEILRALFELTKQVEVVKKQLLRLEKQDDSKLL